MKQFEYHIDFNLNMETFNKLGSDGWELVAVCEGRGFFKRQLS